MPATPAAGGSTEQLAAAACCRADGTLHRDTWAGLLGRPPVFAFRAGAASPDGAIRGPAPAVPHNRAPMEHSFLSALILLLLVLDPLGSLPIFIPIMNGV